MFYLFYPASFLPHKNHSLLNSPKVNDFLKLYDINVYLTVSGLDYYFAGSNIVLLGRISHEKCMHYLRESSALLFLSSFESLGLPLIEAAQLGKPVICPDLIYSRELLGDSAYYFRDKSPFSLCNTLKDFFHDSESDLANCAQLQKPMYSIDHAWDQFMGIFE